MNGTGAILVFRLDGNRYGLSIGHVERIVHAVAVTPVPESPQSWLGIINVQGRVVPVVNLRQMLGLPEKEIDPGDNIIIAGSENRSAAIVVDGVEGIVEDAAAGFAESDDHRHAAGRGMSVFKNRDGFVFLCDRIVQGALEGAPELSPVEA
jgi:purine-binding chemotaxis protein CheW